MTIETPNSQAVDSKETSNKKRLKTATIVIIAVASALGTVGGRLLFEKLHGTDSVTFNGTLIKVADELNRNLPIMVDRNTRLDSTMALPDGKFVYLYTIIGLDETAINKETFADRMRPKLINNYRTEESMKTFRENNMQLLYKYKTEKGESIADITISPRDF